MKAFDAQRPDLKVIDEYIKIFSKRLTNPPDQNEKDKDRKGPIIPKNITSGMKGELVKVLTLNVPTHYLKKALELNKNLHLERAKGYANAGYCAGRLEVKLIRDGIVGMGGGPFKTVFEVGLTIDPVTGLPYYPGSGIKGAVRSYIEKRCAELSDLFQGGKKECENKFRDLAEILFGEGGTNGHVSLVTFTDLIPIGCPNNKPCSVFRGLVINPHYYSGGQLVRDELSVSPTPVIHVGIPRGLVFGMTIAIRNDANRIKEALDKIQNVLNVLKENGPLPRPWNSVETLLSSNSLNDQEKLLLITMYLTLHVLRKGIAGRSLKGYNKFEPFECEDLNNCLNFNVVTWEVSPPHKPSSNVNKPRKGGGHPHRGGRRSHGKYNGR